MENSGTPSMAIHTLIRKVFPLILYLVIPSLYTVHKVGGLAGLILYAIVTSLLLFLLYSNDAIPRLLAPKKSIALAWPLTGLTLIGVFLIFGIIYPIANSGVVGGGSDHDDALNVAVNELIHGRYPYYKRTYLDAPITPMPGSILLSLPFVLLGNSAYQNLFWVIVLYLFTRHLYQNKLSALMLFWVMLGLAPIFLHVTVIGSDYVSNAVFLMVSMIWMYNSLKESNTPLWQKIVSSALFGLALSSRLNLAVVSIPLFFLLWKKAGWKDTTIYCTLSAVVFLSVTLPFYFYDPANFSPLHTFGKLNQFNAIFPYFSLGTSVATVVLALLISLLFTPQSGAVTLLQACAFFLLFPVLCALLPALILDGDFFLSTYGSFAMVFGAVGYWSSFDLSLFHAEHQTWQSN